MIKGLIFDLNGTLIDIYTSESDEKIYRLLSNFLDYYGITISPDTIKYEYFSILAVQKRESIEEFPEFDVIKLFEQLLDKYAPYGKERPSPETMAILFRAAGRYKLALYDDVFNVLENLSRTYPMSAVSDGQKIWAIPELESLGLDRFFKHTVISSEHHFRKPDPQMFEMALEKMHLAPDEAIFVGNDMYRDIYGAHNIGMKTVFFRSNQGEQSYSGAEADYIIYNFRELLNAVDFLNNN